MSPNSEISDRLDVLAWERVEFWINEILESQATQISPSEIPGLHEPRVYFSDSSYQENVIARFDGQVSGEELLKSILESFDLVCPGGFLIAYTGWDRVWSWVSVKSTDAKRILVRLFETYSVDSGAELLLMPIGSASVYGLFCNEYDYVLSKIGCKQC